MFLHVQLCSLWPYTLHKAHAEVRNHYYYTHRNTHKQDLSLSHHVFILLPEDIFNFFSFLQDVFSNEFIFVPGKTSQVWLQLAANYLTQTLYLIQRII